MDDDSGTTARARLVGVALALVCATAGAVALREGLGPLLQPNATDIRPSVVLGDLALAAAGLALLWLGALLTAAASALGRGWGAPGPVGRAARGGGHAPVVAQLAAVLVALAASPSAAVGIGPAAPTAVAASTASPGPGPAYRPGPDAGTDQGPAPVPGWRPTRPPEQPAAPVQIVSRGGPADDHVVVRRGDTLWGIVARHLGPDTDIETVAEQWPRWYAANRSVIGPDPDLILPGQQLQPPVAGDTP